MSVIGCLICPKCLEDFDLGKWIWDDQNAGIGFLHPDFTEGQLGNKTLHFLARHMDHGVQMISIDVFSQDYDMNIYREVDDDLRGDPLKES